jgi:hypothetical protein
VPQRGRLLKLVPLDRTRGKGNKAVVTEIVVTETVLAEAVAVVKPAESLTRKRELWAVPMRPVLAWNLP